MAKCGHALKVAVLRRSVRCHLRSAHSQHSIGEVLLVAGANWLEQLQLACVCV
jgi:hypothetical protein